MLVQLGLCRFQKSSLFFPFLFLPCHCVACVCVGTDIAQEHGPLNSATALAYTLSGHQPCVTAWMCYVLELPIVAVCCFAVL